MLGMLHTLNLMQMTDAEQTQVACNFVLPHLQASVDFQEVELCSVIVNQELYCTRGSVLGCSAQALCSCSKFLT